METINGFDHRGAVFTHGQQINLTSEETAEHRTKGTRLRPNKTH